LIEAVVTTRYRKRVKTRKITRYLRLAPTGRTVL